MKKAKPPLTLDLEGPITISLPDKPITNPLLGVDGASEQRYATELDLVFSALKEKRAAKFRILVQSLPLYEHEKEDWRAIAYLIAEKYVPGMQAVREVKKGRPETWRPEKLLKLRRAIEREIEAGTITVLDACKKMKLHPDWSKVSAETLRRKYHAATAVEDALRQCAEMRARNSSQCGN